ncbi:MAG: hypothetical protein ONB12_11660 [candidate division KSB1 bacterium]|nr:hypothetical protein [candidate division KSB1 bacterium]
MKKIFVLLLLLFAAMPVEKAAAQGKPYDGPDDPAGDIAAVREGYMTGNRVFITFKNQCELADWPRVEVSKWPNDATGSKMTDGVNILITAQVFLDPDTTKDPNDPARWRPVTDPVRIATEKLDTLWYCQTAFRGGYDVDPTGTIPWIIYPVFGYFNELSEYPAMSNLPESWPPKGWPARGDQLKWPGVWNGRFGLGVMYADLETYFACNDAQDQEYLQPTSPLKYYPRPGVKIGDKRPDVTIQYGAPWGGIGVRVEARGYQWNNPLARDAIFWEYNVSNISDYDLPQVAFGFHVDNAIGNDANDEIGFFDTYLDMAFSWDINGVGSGGLKVGTMGFAYLESPGAAYDGVDNDQDGLIDEKRDNPTAGRLLGPEEGIADLEAFLKYYALNRSDLRPHWEGDEDQDWMDGDDKNGNGIYDIDENPGDDVGLDGIGPGELNYPGPDEGECNHRPDFLEGFGCEPNYNFTDVTESDMIGLTAFTLFPVAETLNGKPKTFHQDWVMWQLTGTGMLKEYIGEISNLIEIFASGPFPLYKGRTERVSMSMLHSFDDLNGLNQKPPQAPILYELKRVVQLIYEKDYRFAQPPKMPTLSATAYDGKVVLTWDDVADKATREPFLRGANDFEGYKLIRATDKKFQDAMVITDGYGTPSLYKAIYQCDLKNGKRGFTNYGLLNGMGYYLGDDTGITHYFIDENVQNGVTYYYGLAAYDYGITPDLAPPGIAPSENNLVIELDEFEEIRRIGQNIAIVTPHTTPPEYTPPSLQILANSLKKTSGWAQPKIVAKNALKPNHIYTMKFTVKIKTALKDTPNGYYYLTNGYEIYDVTDSNRVIVKEDPNNAILDNLVYDRINFDETAPEKDWFLKIGSPLTSDIADGVVIQMQANHISSLHGGFDLANSGWVQGNAAIGIAPTEDAVKYFPWDYELIFTNNPKAYVGKAAATKTVVRDTAGPVPPEMQLARQPWPFFMINKTFPHATGEYDTLDVIGIDDNANGVFDWKEDRVLFGVTDDRNRWKKSVFVVKLYEQPQAGDVYFATFNRPFFTCDSLTFKVLPEGELNLQKINEEMDRITVVPNPYIASNDMEPAVFNQFLNQRRRIMFTHLPAQCKITIFTVSGVFVDEIDVENAADNGIAHWDLKSSEGLDIAAGMYLYHVKSKRTGAEKIGKFAIIK